MQSFVIRCEESPIFRGGGVNIEATPPRGTPLREIRVTVRDLQSFVRANTET